MTPLKCVSPIDGSLYAQRTSVTTTSARLAHIMGRPVRYGGGLSVIGYHNLTRPKSYHLKKITS